MGIDLTLAAITTPNVKPWIPSATIRLDRDYELHDRIRELELWTLPEPLIFMAYEEDGLRARSDDCYGRALRMSWAGKLSGIKRPDHMSVWNKAAWSFLRELPIDIPVVLLWS